MKSRHILAPAVALMLALGLFGCNSEGESSQEGSVQDEPVIQEVDVESEGEVEPEPVGAFLDDYSWAELSQMSNEISEAAAQGGDPIAIASGYGLCEPDGTLNPLYAKTITLADGTQTAVQIIGIAHDYKSDGGIAGITFAFEDSIALHPMNATDTNKGGWASSEMRSYLEEQVAILPADLQDVIVAANKYTNNSGETDTISSVSVTPDRLWLLSAVEVWGEGVDKHFGSKVNANLGFNLAKVFDEEGEQYQAFLDIEDATENERRDFFTRGDKGNWWLRSPYSVSDDDFKLVGTLGDSNQGGADASWEVVPCFCI